MGQPVLGGQELSLKPYDETYYTAYDVNLPVLISGLDGCSVTKNLPDIDAALESISEALAAIPADGDAEEMGFPEVGAKFATDVRITCPAGS